MLITEPKTERDGLPFGAGLLGISISQCHSRLPSFTVAMFAALFLAVSAIDSTQADDDSTRDVEQSSVEPSEPQRLDIDDAPIRATSQFPQLFVSDGESKLQEENTPAESDSVSVEQFEKPIGSLRANIRPISGLLPENVAAGIFASKGKVSGDGDRGPAWIENSFSGHATSFCHRPLYFEETFLERYGHVHTCCLGHKYWDSCGCKRRNLSENLIQPIISAARFYGTVPLIPYKMVSEPWCRCVNTQGIYPAGHDSPPRELYPRLNLGGAAFEGGAIVGLLFLIP